MANPFVNFLSGVQDGSGNMKDYQHAARLYVDNFYELAPKAGWMYYVVLNINPKLAFNDPTLRGKFETWVNRYKGSVGLLAKNVDLPKFTVQTETLNQYNKKTVIQKSITYNPVSLTFHDDMANVTTDLWRNYYQYYYADSNDSRCLRVPSSIIPKYADTKYNENPPIDNRYGLNNGQDVSFFTSIDIYQLHKGKFTSFKLVNPLIKEWAHDQLDQTQGGRMLTSKMTVEYETVIYNTDPRNRTTQSNPGFAKDHYDTSPSPLSIGGNGTNSVLGIGGFIDGASEIFGDVSNFGTASPLDIIGTVLKGGNLLKNAGNLSTGGILEEGYSILNSTLKNISSTSVNVTNPDGSISSVPASDSQRISQGISNTVSGIKNVLSPAGINLFSGSNTADTNVTHTTPSTLT